MMPLYEFHCEGCSGVREELMSYRASGDVRIKCPFCHKKMKRTMSRPGLLLIPLHGVEGFGTPAHAEMSAKRAGNDI